MMKLHYWLAILLCSVSQHSLAQGDPIRGEALSQTCAACHNPDGNSVNPIWPKLAGQHAAYTRKQLENFKAGKRVNAQMNALAAGLSEEDIMHLAAYYASRKIKQGEARPEALELGERLYRYGDSEAQIPACMACHGPAGAGNPGARYPALGGQHAAYTAAQLRLFKSGERNNDLNNIMRSIAASMTEAQIDAIANYIQGLY